MSRETLRAYPVELPIQDLRVGALVNDGGEGAVYHLADDPRYMLKTFFTPRPLAPLRSLIDLPSRLTLTQRVALTERTAWPISALTDGAGAAAGCLIPAAPPRFFHVFEAQDKRKLRELQYLMFSGRSAKLKMAQPSLSQLLELFRQWAEVLLILHQDGVVYGDISARNWVYAIDPEPSAYVIDCDNLCVLGEGAVRPAVSPDWADPHGGDPSPASDSYRFALALARAIAGENLPGIAEWPPARLPGRPTAPTRINVLIQRAAQKPDGRPSLREWVIALGGDVSGLMADQRTFDELVFDGAWDEALQGLRGGWVRSDHRHADLIVRHVLAESGLRDTVVSLDGSKLVAQWRWPSVSAVTAAQILVDTTAGPLVTTAHRKWLDPSPMASATVRTTGAIRSIQLVPVVDLGAAQENPELAGLVRVSQEQVAVTHPGAGSATSGASR